MSIGNRIESANEHLGRDLHDPLKATEPTRLRLLLLLSLLSRLIGLLLDFLADVLRATYPKN
jgi:hypothetical protein